MMPVRYNELIKIYCFDSLVVNSFRLYNDCVLYSEIFGCDACYDKRGRCLGGILNMINKTFENVTSEN